VETRSGEEFRQVREVRIEFREGRVRLTQVMRYRGEVGLSHLQSKEEEAGAFGVEGVVREAAADLGEGDLEGFGVDDGGQVEGGARGPGTGGRTTRGVVVEAELLAAEGGRAAALAGGVEIMAGEKRCGHGGFSLVALRAVLDALTRVKGRKGPFLWGYGLKAKGPALGRAFCLSSSI
jgi:hypothetical protein